MAFSKYSWINRATEFPNRRRLIVVDANEGSGIPIGQEIVVDAEREEGRIIEDGDPFSGDTMNNLEQRIADALEDVDAHIGTLDAQNFKLTGNQTASGVKTFLFPPVSATNPTANNQLSNKAYVDSQSTSASSSAVNAAKAFTKSANGITNTGWTSATGYYQKTTGQTIPSGYDATYVGVSILDDTSAVNLSQSTFIRAVNVGGTVFLRVGAVPTGTINVGLAFFQTRSS